MSRTTAPPRPQAEYAPEIPARNLPTIVLFGIAILLAGLDQPLLLTVIAASLSGVVMFIYSGLLIALNRRFLPEPIKVRGIRLGALAWCFAFFGVFSIIYGVEQFKQLF